MRWDRESYERTHYGTVSQRGIENVTTRVTDGDEKTGASKKEEQSRT